MNLVKTPFVTKVARTFRSESKFHAYFFNGPGDIDLKNIALCN